MSTSTRRKFLQDVTVAAAAALVASRLQPLAARQAAAASPWRSRIGLELYTVRDLLAADYEGTLAKVAAIGYTEVEPTSYNNMSPKDFRAMLDRYKLTMPSTHSAARGEGAELDRMLEGFQVMGIKYTEIQAGGARGGGPAAAPGARGASGAGPAGAGGAAPPGRPANLPPGAYYAIAVEYVAQGEWSDPEWLARASRKATRFMLDDGTTRMLELKLAGS